MTSLQVPCVLVDKHNLQKWWPNIIDALSQSDFLAIDLELSGLGSKDLFSTQIDERFKALKEVASTRAILSMGLACFKINSEKGIFKRKRFRNNLEKATFDQIHDCIDESLDVGNQGDEELENDEDFHISVTVFDFLCLCNEYVIESKSMKFLVQQGFDFNEQAKNGIPFVRGNDSKFEETSFTMRSLLARIIAIQPTIIFHNGLLDLAFLYQNFYSELPNNLQSFVADLYEMFPNGIFDTKYIANSCLSNSYLEYLFNYSQRKNYFRKINNQPCINLKLDDFNGCFPSDIRVFDLSAKILQPTSEETKICDNYAKYGWCEKLDMCHNSHNIDLILDEELRSKKDKKSKQLINLLKSLACSSSDGESTPMRKGGSHHSGNDAFMTGYYFLFYLVLNSNKFTYSEFKKYYQNLTKFKNKIFLSGKIHPLNIMKSSFSKTSKSHKEKINKILENKDNSKKKPEKNGTH